MHLLTAFAVLAFAWLSPLATSHGEAYAFLAQPLSSPALVERVKIVCGDTPQGYRCRSERGAVRRGKMQKIPKSKSSSPSDGGETGGNFWGGAPLMGGGSLWGGNKDAAPAAAPSDGSAGTGTAAAGGCPPNTERLGGYCIPYTQSCRAGLAANAPPQTCRSAQEKLVCNFRQDGLKDCCCRIYSQN